MSKITLIGLYNYTEGTANDIFTSLTLPTGIDKNLLINTILMRGGEFEAMYPDPVFMKSAVGVWSNKWNRTFTKWFEALALEYNPIENYDRIEETTITDSGSNSKTSSATTSTEGTSSDSSTNSGTATSNNKISAYNSDAMVNDSETSSSSSNTSNGSTSLSNSGESESTESGTTSNSRVQSSRIHGNIGVTTSSAMLLESLGAAQWNLYEHISDIFLSEFVIPIY